MVRPLLCHPSCPHCSPLSPSSPGLDAAYTDIGPDTVARFTFELGTTVRLRMGIDVPKTLQQTPQTDGAYVLQPQLKGGLAYVF